MKIIKNKILHSFSEKLKYANKVHKPFGHVIVVIKLSFDLCIKVSWYRESWLSIIEFQ